MTEKTNVNFANLAIISGLAIVVAFGMILLFADRTTSDRNESVSLTLGDADSSNESSDENINISEEQTMRGEDVSEFNMEFLVEGTGKETEVGDTISVHYTGTILDGTKFDSSVDRGEPFDFTLGEGSVIAGWDEGLVGIPVGSKVKLTIPSSMGYGERGAGGVILPGSALIFEVEILSAE